MQIPDLLAQFVSSFHAHSNTHKPPKSVVRSVFMVENNFQLKCIGLVNTYRLTKKKIISKNPKNKRWYLYLSIKDRELGFQI